MNTSLFTHSVIWCGAAISIAEIITGAYLAPLGFIQGLIAILIGHTIGGILLFMAGFIGSVRRQSAMNSVKLSFGDKGAVLFALLNVIQLLGWSAIMIYDAAKAAGGIAGGLGDSGWAWLIGGLITLWLALGLRRARWINAIAVAGLLLLSFVLAFGAFGSESKIISSKVISFGAAIELSIAMPLSWLPLISDYTKDSKSPLKASAISALSYTVASCFMYAVGMVSAINSGANDMISILLSSPIGAWGLGIVVVLSAVTTTFLDAHSAGVSMSAINPKINVKAFSIAVIIVASLGAASFKMDDITEFLYLISSVFAPMIAILMVDFFILRQDFSKRGVCWINLCVWLAGFVLYRYLLTLDTPLGNTVPDMIITAILCLALNGVKRLFAKSG